MIGLPNYQCTNDCINKHYYNLHCLLHLYPMGHAYVENESRTEFFSTTHIYIYRSPKFENEKLISIYCIRVKAQQNTWITLNVYRTFWWRSSIRILCSMNIWRYISLFFIPDKKKYILQCTVAANKNDTNICESAAYSYCMTQQFCDRTCRIHDERFSSRKWQDRAKITNKTCQCSIYLACPTLIHWTSRLAC